MASVRISELPLVTGINDNDVIVINEQNVISSGITLRDFTNAFTGQDLEFTGDVTFQGEATFNNDLEVNGEANFNNVVTFEETVVFKNNITIDNFEGINLDSLSDVEVPNPNHLDLLLYNQPFNRWEANGTVYMKEVANDLAPVLGGNLDVQNKFIISSNDNDISFFAASASYNFLGNGLQPSRVRLTSEVSSTYIDITLPVSTILEESYRITLPAVDGAVGQVLATDGNGNLYWTTNQGSGGGDGGDGDGGGGGIALTDLSVTTITPDGGGTLTYNPANGVFFFAPADISSITGIDFDDLEVQTTLPNGGGSLVYDDNGTFIFAPADLTAAGGGIELNDLEVVQLPANGGGSLSYNNLNGQFSYAPADLTDYLTNISAEKIGELLDVDDSGITNGQALIYDGADQTYKPGNMSLGNASLDDLSDVDTTGKDDGDYLVWNEDDAEWKAAPLAIGPAIVYKGVCNLTAALTDPSNSDVSDADPQQAGFFYVNEGANAGAIDASWTGLSGTAQGLEYVVFTVDDDWAILGRTGDLAAITEIQAGDGIGVDETPDATKPTIFLTDTTVVPGDYTWASFTVNDKGQLTAASNGDTDGLLEDYARLDGADFTGEITVNGNFTVNLDGSIETGELKFPIVDGTEGQTLGTDGNGNIIFFDPKSSVTVDSNAPTDNEDGDLWFDDVTGILYIWYTDDDSSQWVSIGGSGSTGGASVSVGSNPPGNPKEGDLWFDDIQGLLFVYYTDNSGSSQWVSTRGGGGGGGGTKSFVQDSSPSPADEGDLWRDTTTNFQYVFNGGWKPVEIDIAGLDPLPT